MCCAITADAVIARSAQRDEAISATRVAQAGLVRALKLHPIARPLERRAGAIDRALVPVLADEHRAVVWSQFDHSLNRFSLDGPELKFRFGRHLERSGGPAIFDAPLRR